MLAASFPWDVAITAVSTIAAGLGATLLAARSAHSYQVTQWRLEEQCRAAQMVLEAWTDLYLALSAARRQGRPARGEDGWSSGPVADTSAWNSALERLALVADPELVERARDLDGEMWRLSTRIKELGALDGSAWLKHTTAAKDARRRFLNAARSALGASRPITTPQGKPPEDDPIWDADYWAAERQRLRPSKGEPVRER